MFLKSALSRIFSYPYLFGELPPILSRSDKIYLWLAIIFLLAGIVLLVVTARSRSIVQKKLLQRGRNLCLTIGVLGLIWFAFRYEMIRFLSTHFIILTIYFLGLVWGLWIFIYWIRGYGADLAAYEKEQIKKRYL